MKGWSKKKVKQGLIIIVVLLCVFLGFEIGKRWERFEFVRVIDGDTIVVRNLRNREETRLRMMGINAPDLGECFYKESGVILGKNLEGRTVTYKMFGRDGFGRYLGIVYANKVDVAQKMMEEGAAVAYNASEVHDELRPSTEYFDRLVEFEEKPKAKKLGVWSDLCLR